MGGNHSCIPEDKKKETHVVIVGGGYGGVACAMSLKKQGVRFTLVDSKDFFHNVIGSLRSAVVPDFAKCVTIDYATTFGDSFVRGKVTAINLNERTVTLDNGNTVDPFTHLVIATGSVGPFPGKSKGSTTAEEFDNEYREACGEVERAESVVIVGGGSVGVELAGEIRDKYKAKKITLIHSRERLLADDFGAKVQAAAKAGLEAADIQLKFGEKVENFGDLTLNKFTKEKQTVKTDKGNAYEADLIFRCTGLKADTSMIENVFEKAKFTEDGARLRVTGELLVDGFSHVFAVGDCTDVAEEKMAAHAETHGETVAKNIVLSLCGKDMKKYAAKFVGQVVPIGRGGGVGVYNGWSMPSFAVAHLKGKDLFYARYWKNMGQKPHPLPY